MKQTLYSLHTDILNPDIQLFPSLAFSGQCCLISFSQAFPSGWERNNMNSKCRFWPDYTFWDGQAFINFLFNTCQFSYSFSCPNPIDQHYYYPLLKNEESKTWRSSILVQRSFTFEFMYQTEFPLP